MNGIYEMKLGETLSPENSNHSIMRVPGGWIYMCYNEHYKMSGVQMSAIFVPYNEEFKGKE